MNKILIAGVLMFVGGFALADAANLDLLADVGRASSSASTKKQVRASVTPFPGANTKDACNVAFRQAEEAYKVATRIAKEKRDLAVRAKNACLKKVSDIRKATPTPTSTSAVR